jgi:hypothetical protein
MEPAQEWCLQCGAVAPGGLTTRSPSWRSSAVILGAVALLALGAAGAAYAALAKTKVRHVVIVQVPAKATAAVPTTPAIPTTPPATPQAVPTTPTPPLPTTAVKPPAVPTTTPTPKATTPIPAATTPKTTPKATPKKAPAPNPAAQLPAAILLDTNSVATYNPEGYPVETFGDPNLAVDGDSSTGWTARVNPAIAPRMAVGLLIDLNTPQKLSALQLITATPGMTVQVFGSTAASAPTAITNPAWTPLSADKLQKERHTLIKLSNSTKAFRFITLWISGAPPGSIGTPTAPGRVSVNEVELFPPK